MNNTESLWPAITLEGATTPKSILAEQANILAEMTKNVLKAYIVRVETEKTDTIKFKFQIIAPVLNNYTYDLFYVRYNLLQIYPIELEVYSKIIVEIREVSNEKDFKENIQSIFSAPKTIQVIKALYAQSVQE